MMQKIENININLYLLDMSLSRDYMAYSLGNHGSTASSSALPVSQNRSDATPSVETLPVSKLLASDLQDGEMYKCPITHESLTEGAEIIKLPCGHIFNPGAIKQWLRSRATTCPVCRARVDCHVDSPPAVSTQPIAVVSAPDGLGIHEANIEALAQSILALQERQVLRLAQRRAQRLLHSIQRDVLELRDLGYYPSVDLASILPTRPPLLGPRYGLPSRTGSGNMTILTRQWLEEAARQNPD